MRNSRLVVFVVVLVLAAFSVKAWAEESPEPLEQDDCAAVHRDNPARADQCRQLKVQLAELMATTSQKPGPAVSYTLTTSILNQYLGSNGAVFHDHLVFQPDLYVAFRHGLSLDVWVSGGKGPMKKGFDNEGDLTFDQSGEHHSIGVAYFAINELPADVVQLYAKLGLPFEKSNRIILPYIWFEHYLATSGNNPGRGSMVRLGLQHNQGNERWAFSQRIGAFYDTGAFDSAEGTLAEWQGKILRNFRGISIGPTIKCAAPIHLSFDDGRKADCAVGLLTQNNF